MKYWWRKLKIFSNWTLATKNFVIFNNFLNWYEKFSSWLFFYLGFYLDEFFSKFLKGFSIKILSLPSFFILDKFFSNWTGAGFFKNLLQLFGNFLYFERLEFFFIFLSTLLIVFFSIYMYILFLFI